MGNTYHDFSLSPGVLNQLSELGDYLDQRRWNKWQEGGMQGSAPVQRKPQGLARRNAYLDQQMLGEYLANQGGTQPSESALISPPSESALISPDLGNFQMGQNPRQAGPLPAFGSQPYQNMAMGIGAQQLQGLQQLGQVDQARLGLINSQAGYYRARTQAEGRAPRLTQGDLKTQKMQRLSTRIEYMKDNGLVGTDMYERDVRDLRDMMDLKPETTDLQRATQQLEYDTKRQIFSDLQQTALGKLPPEAHQAFLKSKAESARIETLQKEFDLSNIPRRRQLLQAQLDNAMAKFDPPVTHEKGNIFGFPEDTVTQTHPNGGVKILYSPEGKWGPVKKAVKGDNFPEGSSYQRGPNGEVRILTRPRSGFSQSYTQKILGELTTGAPSSILGVQMEVLQFQEDFFDHATNSFGPLDDSPEWRAAWEIIKDKPKRSG